MNKTLNDALVTLRMPLELVQRVDKWASEQDIAHRTTAIKQLLRRALKAEGK